MDGSETRVRPVRAWSSMVRRNGADNGMTLPPPRLPWWTAVRPVGLGSNEIAVASAGRSMTGASPTSFPLVIGSSRVGQMPDFGRWMRPTCPGFTRMTTVRLDEAAETPATSASARLRLAAGASSSRENVAVSWPVADTWVVGLDAKLMGFAALPPGPAWANWAIAPKTCEASLALIAETTLASACTCAATCVALPWPRIPISEALCSAGSEPVKATTAVASEAVNVPRDFRTDPAASAEIPPSAATKFWVASAGAPPSAAPMDADSAAESPPGIEFSAAPRVS